MNKLAALVAGTALAALAAGCTTDTTANLNASGNSNTAVVVNNNGNANTSGITTTNSNTTRTVVTREEYMKDRARYDKEARENANTSGGKIGQGAEDAWLWTKTKAALAAENDLRDSTINVDVENGVIILRGNVASQAQVSKADAVAKTIEGKKSVKNELKVSASGSSTAVNANTTKTTTTTTTKRP